MGMTISNIGAGLGMTGVSAAMGGVAGATTNMLPGDHTAALTGYETAPLVPPPFLLVSHHQRFSLSALWTATVATIQTEIADMAARYAPVAATALPFFNQNAAALVALAASSLVQGGVMAMTIFSRFKVADRAEMGVLIDRAKNGEMGAAHDLKRIADQSPASFTEGHVQDIVSAAVNDDQFPKIGILDSLVRSRLELFKNVSLDVLRRISQSGNDAAVAVEMLEEIRVGQSHDDGHSVLAAVHTANAKDFAGRGLFSMSIPEYEAAIGEGAAAARFAEVHGAMGAAMVQYRKLAVTHGRLADIYFKTGAYLKSLDAFFEADQAMDTSAGIQTKMGDFEGLYRSRSTQISGYLVRAAEISGRLGNKDALLKIMLRKLEIAETDYATLKDHQQAEGWLATVQGRADFSSEIAQFYEAARSYGLAAKYYERAGDAFAKLEKTQNDLRNFEEAHEAWRSGIAHLNKAAEVYALDKQYLDSARLCVMAANVLENMAYQIHRRHPEGSQGLYQAMREAYDEAVGVLKQGGFWDDIQSALDGHMVVYAVEGRLLHPLEAFVVHFDTIRGDISSSRGELEDGGDAVGAARLNKVLTAIEIHEQWTAHTGMRKSLMDTLSSLVSSQGISD